MAGPYRWLMMVFAAGVFDTASGQLAGIAFVADKNLDDY